MNVSSPSGAPLALELTISEGLLSSVRELSPGKTVLQTTAQISPGSSGGGLFDSEGALIGITSFQITGGQNISFAWPADLIAALPRVDATKPAPSPAVLAAHRQLAELGTRLRATDSAYNKKMPYIEKVLTAAIERGDDRSTWAGTAEAAYVTAGYALVADELSERGDWPAVLEHGERWRAADPRNFYAHFLVGRASTELSGLAIAEAADLVGPSGTPGRRDMKRARELQAVARDFMLAAIEAYRASLELNPQYVDAWVRLGFSYVSAGDTASALAVVKALESIDAAASQRLAQAVALLPKP